MKYFREKFADAGEGNVPVIINNVSACFRKSSAAHGCKFKMETVFERFDKMSGMHFAGKLTGDNEYFIIECLRHAVFLQCIL